MTTGVLIFAYNNEHIDYLAMANWSAKNIRRHLNLPVCVVTDQVVPDTYKFEQVIYATTDSQNSRWFADIDATVTWYNGNRSNAYELSPWDQTLVLDADYVVASNQLTQLLDATQDFLCHRRAYDVSGNMSFDENNFFGKSRMPMNWATVMLFRRSKTTELIFETMQMARDNWSHYRNLYGILKSTYRNDFALSIAMNTVDGHTMSSPTIPWELASVLPEHKLTQLDTDRYRVDFVTQDNKPRWITLTSDFHAIGKKHLGDIIANSR
jgi:hypothetical protein